MSQNYLDGAGVTVLHLHAKNEGLCTAKSKTLDTRGMLLKYSKRLITSLKK